ncbi:hypothetical protein J437_LFUL008018 [Ladona fulva]|uniref:THUMP domain-containing protein n=1 Tax=Ladona fulva TaxID=123851 RepID=A0A8K0KGA4_LADFU|nr:hypothetical protein J437_LFUL008018 [Ladona fulva]
MSEGRQGRGSYGKRKANYWNADQRKRKSNYNLDVGQKGFICTCNFNEKQCIREAYNILNEFNDVTENVSETPEEVAEEEEDVEAALAKEVKALQDENSSGNKFRKFQVVETGLNNCIFIRTTIQDPVGLVVKIMEEVKTKKQRKTRFLLRMLPVEVTCKATPKQMEEALKPLMQKYFSSEGKTFSIIYRARYNNSVVRDEVIELFAGLVKSANPMNRADLNNPQLAVLVEIMKSICCVSVVPNFYGYKKYNLSELVSPTMKENPGSGDADSSKGLSGEAAEGSMVPKEECDGQDVKENPCVGEQNVSELGSPTIKENPGSGDADSSKGLSGEAAEGSMVPKEEYDGQDVKKNSCVGEQNVQEQECGRESLDEENPEVKTETATKENSDEELTGKDAANG